MGRSIMTWNVLVFRGHFVDPREVVVDLVGVLKDR